MARLRTIGFEAIHASTPQNSTITGEASFEGTTIAGTNVSVTRSTSIVRSGKYSLNFTNTTAYSQGTWQLQNLSIASGNTLFVRGYYYFSSFPSSGKYVFSLIGVSNGYFGATISSTGEIQAAAALATPALTPLGTAQIIGTGKWYRVELALKIQTGSTDYAELKIDGSTIYSSTTLGISDSQPNTYQIGIWNTSLAAGGNTSGVDGNFYVDDIALNDSTGSYENSWPGIGNIILLKPKADSARTSWTSGNGGTTSLFDAVNNTPPVGVASASQTATSNIEDTVKTANNYDATMANYSQATYGHDGLLVSSGSYAIGQTTGTLETAYKFIAPETISVSGLVIALHKTGSPTDNIVVAIKSDSSGTPGTILSSGSVAATSLTTTPAEYTITLGSNVTLTAATTYWIHFSRSGSSSLTDYCFASITNADFVIPNYLSVFYTNSGLGWSAQSNYTGCLRWVFIDGSGNQTIKLVQPVVDTAEDISTGTKTGTFQITSNPAGTLSNITSFGNDAGAAGTWPTNWYAYWGTPDYYPNINLNTNPIMQVKQTDTGGRVALIDFMGIYVEYVDINDGPTVTWENTTFPDQNYYLGPFKV